ncbi:hypothetical protein OROHE_014143 [Orobanche hederae]
MRLTTFPAAVSLEAFQCANDEIDDIFDDEFISTTNGGFQHFLDHWKNHPSLDNLWMLEDLRVLVPQLLTIYLSASSTGASSLKGGGGEMIGIIKVLKVYAQDYHFLYS